MIVDANAARGESSRHGTPRVGERARWALTAPLSVALDFVSHQADPFSHDASLELSWKETVQAAKKEPRRYVRPCLEISCLDRLWTGRRVEPAVKPHSEDRPDVGMTGGSRHPQSSTSAPCRIADEQVPTRAARSRSKRRLRSQSRPALTNAPSFCRSPPANGGTSSDGGHSKVLRRVFVANRSVRDVSADNGREGLRELIARSFSWRSLVFGSSARRRRQGRHCHRHGGGSHGDRRRASLSGKSAGSVWVAAYLDDLLILDREDVAELLRSRRSRSFRDTGHAEAKQDGVAVDRDALYLGDGPVGKESPVPVEDLGSAAAKPGPSDVNVQK